MPAKSYTFLYPLAAIQWSRGSLPFKLDRPKIAIDRLNRPWKWISSLGSPSQTCSFPSQESFNWDLGWSQTKAAQWRMPQCHHWLDFLAFIRVLLWTGISCSRVRTVEWKTTEGNWACLLASAKWWMPFGYNFFPGTVQRLSQALRATSGHTCWDTRVCTSAGRNPENSTEKNRAESQGLK